MDTYQMEQYLISYYKNNAKKLHIVIDQIFQVIQRNFHPISFFIQYFHFGHAFIAIAFLPFIRHGKPQRSVHISVKIPLRRLADCGNENGRDPGRGDKKEVKVKR